MLLLSKFEEISINILDLFDRKEDDGLNHNILLSKISFLDCHLIKLAHNGYILKFISTNAVQKVLKEIWFNSIIFSPKKIINNDLSSKDLITRLKV